MLSSRRILIVLTVALSPNKIIAAPSTADFMNAMTVCGAGSSVQIDANLKGSLKSLYEGEATQGKAVQGIIPSIAKYLPDGDNYKQYLGCISNLLAS